MADTRPPAAEDMKQISREQLWKTLVALLTCDEFMHNRMKYIREHPESTSFDAMLHMAQNQIVLHSVIGELHKVIGTDEFTAEEENVFQDFINRMPR